MHDDVAINHRGLVFVPDQNRVKVVLLLQVDLNPLRAASQGHHVFIERMFLSVRNLFEITGNRIRITAGHGSAQGNVLDTLGRVKGRTRLAGWLLGSRVGRHVFGRAFVTRRRQIQRQRGQVTGRFLRRPQSGVRSAAIGHYREQRKRGQHAQGDELRKTLPEG